MRPKEVGLIGFDGLVATHLTGPADTLSTARLEDGFGGYIPCYKIRFIGLTNAPFTAESGMVFHPDTILATAPPLDTVIIAGGPGARREEVCDVLSEWLSSRAYETRRIASICGGIYPIAQTGLLDGRTVTTHWRCTTDLRRRFPRLSVDHKKRLIKDGPFYSSAGLSGGIDLALALIEEDYGKQVALSVSQELMTYLGEKSVPNETNSSSESALPSLNRFGELIAWMMRNLQEDLTVELMARQACMCPSHFTRAFKSVFGSTPGNFVENLRLNEARRRLSSKRKTVRSVATSVGFRDSYSFRRAFERRFGVGPGEYLKSDVALAITASIATPPNSFPVVER